MLSGCASPDNRAASGRIPTLSLELCVREDGTTTPLWTEGIAVSIGREAAEALSAEHRPLSPEARAWLAVLQEALPYVEELAPALARPFELAPFDAVVAVGNRGSSDGFGWVPRQIGVNLEAFHEAYGPPDEGAVDRMTRIVAHEYVHLLNYERYPDHMEVRDTPLNRALWTMFHEGIGDYVSMSSRWWPAEDGTYSPVARETLERLEPILVERLEAAVVAGPAEEVELRRSIAMGKFDEKWGSLPVALWLRSEAAVQGEQATLDWIVRAGPEGVLPLALRHADPKYRPRLRAVATAREAARSSN